MSEDDRAVKAARAKAMLKKRQQKKVGAPGIGNTSPPASHSLRASSPVPSEVPPVPEENADFGDVFARGDSDTNWVASLPRAETPLSRPPSRPESIPIRRSSSPAVSSPLVPSTPSVDQIEGLRSTVQNLQQVISKLESEKAPLLASLERFKNLEFMVHETENRLQEETAKCSTLDGHVQQLAVDARAADERIQQLTAREKDIIEKSREQIQNHQQTISLLVSEKASLTASLGRLEDLEYQAHAKEALLQDELKRSQNFVTRVHRLEMDLQEAAEKYREQERELLLTNDTVDDLRGAADQHQRRIRELEEHIQSDIRAENLEESLKNTQERADEFEFQLSKLKQAHSTLKAERDEISSQLRLHEDAETEWQTTIAELKAYISASKEQLSTAIADRDALHQDKSTLQTQVDTDQKVLAELEQKLSIAASELMSNMRQLQAAQADLRNACRRADEAGKMQTYLQAEGTNLMRSLDEMRPKIVQLTADKVELGNKIDSLEHTLRTRDAIIAELENSLEEIRDRHEEVSKQRIDAIAQRQHEQSSTQTSLAELQKAFTELQSELEEAKANLHGLESERANHYHETSRQLAEIDRLTMSSLTHADEVSSIRQQLEEHKHLEEEDRGFIERAQEEIEMLRADLASADEEILRLRDAVSSAPSPDGAPKSLDAEMLSALRQQHALDLSAAQSQIRALETSVFDAQAKSHTLQKRVNALEDQLAAPSRSGSRAGRPLSPSSGSSSRAHYSLQPNNLPPMSRSVFDIGLTPETRHKRRVSLAMLKARIDSELTSASHPPSRVSMTRNRPSTLSTVHEPRSQRESLDHSFRKPPQLDDHIFWCSSCRADLIIL